MHRSALILILTVLVAAPAASAQAGPRLLVLEVQGGGEVSADEVAAARALVTDALRGREGLVVATNRDVQQRAPLQADRAASCDEELCLHELADALDASFVLFGSVEVSAEGRTLRLGIFEERSGEIIDRASVQGADIPAIAPFVSAAMDRLLEPVLADAVPLLYERPLFLAGAAVGAVGTLVAIGAGGWAMELELSLGEAERHRDVKQRALLQGPLMLGVAAAGAAIAVAGVGLLLTAVALEP